MSEAKLQNRLDRAKAEIRGLELLIEDRSRALYEAQASVRETARFLERVMGAIQSGVLVFDHEERLRSANPAACSLSGRTEDALIGRSPGDLFTWERSTSFDLATLAPHGEEATLVGDGERRVPVLLTAAPLENEGGAVEGTVCVALDITEKRRMEVELRQAQRLESVGQMAAGVAHEINTPVQFVGDSLDFLRDALGDLEEVFDAYAELKRAPGDAGAHRRVEQAEEAADLNFLREEMPGAVSRAVHGIERVATIVRAMKQFSHPGSGQLAVANLVEGIEATLTVARGETKSIAEVELDLQPIPEVPCLLGDVNQVVLNLVINSAHAIEERFAGTGRRGLIRVGTRLAGDWVEVFVADNGGGIPEPIASRVFDPFFTTKDVGKGTGQGLALARSTIVDKHGGELLFDSEPGEGTTFTIRLPLGASLRKAAA